MKKFFLLLIALVAVLNTYGNPIDADRSEGYFEEIKFEFINNKIIIPVTIDGTVYRFMFDTGAPNVISKEVSENINPRILKTSKTTDAVGNTYNLETVLIPEVSIGNITFKDTKALSYDIRKIDVFNCLNIDGFIGSNLLKNSIVQINFDTQTLTLTNNKHKLDLDKNNSTKMDILGQQHSPFIFIGLQGKTDAKDQVLVDTGMDGFYDISHRSYDIFKNYDILKDIATAVGENIIGIFGNGQKTEQHRVLVPALKIAGTSFLKLTTTTINESVSRIGTDMLKFGLVTIDFKNKRFYFEAKEKAIDVSKPLPEITPTVMNGRLVVGYVWDKKLSNKVAYGDEIIKIDDRNISDMNVCEFMSLKQEFEQKDTLHIVFKTKKGENTKLTIVKKLPNP